MPKARFTLARGSLSGTLKISSQTVTPPWSCTVAVAFAQRSLPMRFDRWATQRSRRWMAAGGPGTPQAARLTTASQRRR